MGVDPPVRRQSQERGGQERHGQLDEERPTPGMRAHRSEKKLADARAVEPDHGEQGARLDHHFERVHLAADQPHHVRREDEVPGRGDGEELGEPLHGSENGRLE